MNDSFNGPPAAGDEAVTQHPPADAELGGASARLAGLFECLALLNRVWPLPRGGTVAEDQAMNLGVMPSNGDGEPPDGDLQTILAFFSEQQGAGEAGCESECIGRFQLLRLLGQGGSGFVFLAYDAKLGRRVALKVPRPETLVSPQLRRRFVQEAKAAGKLDHPNIIAVYDADEIGPICFITSAYCAGPTLAQWLDRRRGGQGEAQGAAQKCGRTREPVPFATAAKLVAQLADAVAHAHGRGVLHRDIKPANVLLERAGDGEQADAGGEAGGQSAFFKAKMGTEPEPSLIPKLTDFGLAKLLDPDCNATRTGAVLGTPAYMAPEQAEGRLSEIGVTTDVYGLGVILYELTAGRPPFQGSSDIETLHAITCDDPPLPRQFRKRVPRDLEAICLKCLEKNPARRYQQSGDLAADLRRFLAGRPTVVRPVGWTGRAAKRVRRHPRATAIVGVLAVTVALAAIFGLGWHADSLHRLEASANERIERQAEEEWARQRRYDYATFIQGAYQAWQNTDLKSAIELLDRCRPRAGEEDLRGWEWYYVRRLCAGGIVTLRGHQGPALGVAFAPDGERLASCGADGTLRIWNAKDSRLEATIAAHRGQANAVAWSGNGRLVATVGDDEKLRIWDAETRTLQRELEGGRGRGDRPPFFRAKMGTDPGDRATDPATTGTGAGWLREANSRIFARGLSKNAPECEGSSTGARLFCVAFSPDGRQVAAAGQEGVVRVWDVVMGEPLHALRGHADAIYSIAFAPDGNRIASGSADKTDRVWDLRSPDKPAVVFEPEAPVVSIAFTPDGRALVTADSMIRLWNIADRVEIGRMNWHSSDLSGIATSADGRLIASAAADTRVLTWDATPPFVPRDYRENNRKLRQTFRGHTNAALYVAFSPQGNRLSSAGKDGTIQIWDPMQPQDRQPLRFDPPESNLSAMEFSASGGMLAIGHQVNGKNVISVWRPFDAVRLSRYQSTARITRIR